MKHILFITTQDLWGEGSKPQRAPGRTVKGYIDAGYKVSIISTRYRNKNYRNLYPLGFFPIIFNSRKLSKVPHFLKVYLLGFLFPFTAIFAGYVIHLRKKVDLIYGYEVHGILGARLLSKIIRRPFIARYQGTVLSPIIFGKVSLKRKIGKIDHFLAFKVKPLLTIMTDDGTQGDIVFKALSPEPNKPFVFWKNGVEVISGNMDNLLREQENISKDALIAITSSRLVKWKNVDRAIRVFAETLKQGMVNDAYLFILGDGPERPNLESIAKELAISDKVKFIGQIPQTSVFSYFQQADIFLSFYDLSNVGNPLLEALRCGLPVLTINVGDTSKVITNMDNGILLSEWNIDRASEQLYKLFSDKKLRDTLSTGASEYSRKNLWTWEERIQAEIQLIKKLI